MLEQSRQELAARIEFRKAALEELRKAYLELLSGRAKSYKIHDRELTRFDLDDLAAEIRAKEAELDELLAEEAGTNGRKLFAFVPRD